MGDSAEQDLELYASLAKERPEQILAIFIRDASTQSLGSVVEGGVNPLDDPTGASIFEQDGTLGIPKLAPPLPQAPTRAMSTSQLPINIPSRSVSESPGLGEPSYARYVPRRARRTYSEAPAGSNFPTSSIPPTQYFPSMTALASPLAEEPSSTTWSAWGGAPRSSSPSRGQPQLFELEKRRMELQLRVHRARLEIPPHIILRVFRAPHECVEAMEMLAST